MKSAEIKQFSLFEEKVKKNNFEEICQAISSKDNLRPDEFGKAINAWSKSALDKKINIVALFSGAGGLDIGFCDAGFSLVESVELEEKFVKTMLFNQANGKYFSGANIKVQDIRLYVPDIATKIDFVIGGPPCQSFSSAGRRAAGVAGTKDDRGSLFEEYVRVLVALNPKGFLFENVYGLLGAEKGESIKKIRKAFKEIGYNTTYRVLDTADYGVPQHRERVIIVGSKDIEFKFPKPILGIDSSSKVDHFSAQEAIKDVSIPENEKLPSINGRFGHLLQEIPPGLNYSFFTEKMGHPHPIFAWRSKFSDFLYKADPLKPIRTLKASGGQYTGPFHWENRHFTIEELKRLQTFPDDYKITGNRAIASKQIGNSVPPQFARFLALSVLDQFFNIKLPFKLHYLKDEDILSFRKLKREKGTQYTKTASLALDSIESKPIKNILSKKFRVRLTDNFKLIVDQESNVEINFIPSKNNWTFELNRDHISTQGELYRVEITKIGKTPLFHEVTSIHLLSNSDELSDYTILWKIFEQKLAKNHIKADLVQLNGYYQYTNDISFLMVKKDDMLKGNVWKVIERILIDPTIGQIQDIKKMVEAYEIEESELINCFYELRKIGFEIRNSNTNPEIENNHFLIPYKFPTLTPLSVQLKKSLQTNE